MWFFQKNILFLFLFLFFNSCEKIKKQVKNPAFCLNLDKKNEEEKKLFKFAKICLKEKKYQDAIYFFEKLLLKFKQTNQIKSIKQIEKKIAKVSFYQVKNYEKALKYYTSLLQKPLSLKDKFLIQKQISKSFFYLKKYNQALKELKKISKVDLSLKEKKELIFLESHILFEKKDFKKALSFFENQIEKYPEEEAFFREYKVFIYEAEREIPLALKELKRLEDLNFKKNFVKQKMEKFKKRQRQNPRI